MSAPESVGIRDAWSEGIPSEIQFWGDVIRTRGLQWPKQFEERVSPETPLQPYITRRLSAPVGGSVRILDVGSGPMTTVGKRWEGRRVEVVALDPLADQYNEALRDAGIAPPVPTIAGHAERLTEIFPEASFDLVHAKNSLDHSYDPLAAIRQMLRVAKPGTWVQLEHATNEAVRQKYHGLHQWNLAVEDARFVIWRPGVRIDVARELADLIEHVDIVVATTEWLSLALQRR